MSGEYLKRYFPFFVRFRLHVDISSLQSGSFLAKVACILFFRRLCYERTCVTKGNLKIF